MRTIHVGTFTEHQLPSIRDFCKQPVTESATECPFCFASEELINQGFRRHVAHHLEELALFALPDIDDGRSENRSSSRDDSFAISSLEIQGNPIRRTEDSKEFPPQASPISRVKSTATDTLTAIEDLGVPR